MSKELLKCNIEAGSWKLCVVELAVLFPRKQRTPLKIVNRIT